MKSIDESEARACFDEVLKEAQRQPIVIRREGQDTAVIVSITSYERPRREDIRAFLQARKDVAAEAAACGLSEDELDKLLRDD